MLQPSSAQEGYTFSELKEQKNRFRGRPERHLYPVDTDVAPGVVLISSRRMLSHESSVERFTRGHFKYHFPVKQRKQRKKRLTVKKKKKKRLCVQILGLKTQTSMAMTLFSYLRVH